MDQEFLRQVQDVLVTRGWGPATAQAEVNYDPAHILELKGEGATAVEAAVEVIRQAENRQNGHSVTTH